MQFVATYYDEFSAYFDECLLFVTSKLPPMYIDEEKLEAHLKSEILGLKSAKILFIDDHGQEKKVVRRIKFVDLETAQDAAKVFQHFFSPKIVPSICATMRCSKYLKLLSRGLVQNILKVSLLE